MPICGACQTVNEESSEFCRNCLGELAPHSRAQPPPQASGFSELPPGIAALDTSAASESRAPEPEVGIAPSAQEDRNPKPESPRSVVSELGAFSIFFACALGLVAYFSLTGLRGYPAFFGIPRHLALGVPPFVLGVAFLIAGVLVLSTRRRAAVLATIGCAITFGILFVVFALLTNVSMIATPIGLVLLLVPALVVWRGRKAVQECDQHARTLR